MDITVSISDIDKLTLENDIIDIQEWVNDAVAGKINACRKRMIKEWQPKLFDDPAVNVIPANESDFIQLVCARPDYQSRVVRESETSPGDK